MSGSSSSERPQFGFSVTPGPPAGVAAEAAEAEAMGFDRIGIWDSPALFREPWVTLAAVAGATRRIRLGTWVTNPVTRHPLVTASAAASLPLARFGEALDALRHDPTCHKAVVVP